MGFLKQEQVAKDHRCKECDRLCPDGNVTITNGDSSVTMPVHMWDICGRGEFHATITIMTSDGPKTVILCLGLTDENDKP